MPVTCPKGHSSTETDFCSECGAKIAGVIANSHPVSVAEVCPDCHANRALEGGKYCEICGYNFETGAHGEIPMQPIEPEPPSAPPAAQAPPEPDAAAAKWVLEVTVDPALKEAGSPDPPADWSPLSVPADRETLLIGRTSQSRAIHPDVPLDFDAAVSHRHAVLSRNDGEGWFIRDIGSANGTRLNGKDLPAMTDTPLSPGDRVTLGHWTCLTLMRES